MRRPLLLLLFVLCTLPLWPEGAWVAIEVVQTDEPALRESLESHGIRVLSWTNAVVEISAFEGLETVLVSSLSHRLTPQDPRWDPWLRGIIASFEPRSGSQALWVPSDRLAEARALVARSASASDHSASSDPVSPPFVTGWTLVSLGLLFLVFFLLSGILAGWPSPTRPGLWFSVPTSVVTVALGLMLLWHSPPGSTPSVAKDSASWLQHRWFQEAWPWGAVWDDYAPDRAWTFRSYERHDGRLREVEAQLTSADRSWEATVEGSLDPHHAVRIFGFVNP